MAKRARQKRGDSSRSTVPPPAPHNPVSENWRTVVVVLVAVVLLAGLAYAVTHRDDDEPNGNGNGNGDVLPNLGPADEFHLISIDGEPVDLGILRGRIVVLDLFAIWCPPCQDQMEELQKLHAHYPETEVVIVSIDVEDSETPEDIRAFKDQYQAAWRFCADTDDVGIKYEADQIPTMAIIDRQGNLRWLHQGVTSSDNLIKMIDPLLPGGV